MSELSDNITVVVVERIPECDVHKYELKAEEPVPAEYDAKTSRGPWAFMCHSCFVNVGLGLGTGLGQKLVLREKS